MRKKKFVSKLLSIMLSAAVVVSSSFGGITLVDVNATEAVEATTEETVAVSDNSAEEAEVEVTETEVMETEVTETEAEITETEETEVSEEPVKAESAEEETVVEDTQETKGAVTEEIELDMSTPASSVVPNVALRKTLLYLYNEEESASLTLDSFILEHIVQIDGEDGELNVAEAATAAAAALNDSTITPAAITNCVGIGYVASTVVDVTGTGITQIPGSAFTYTNKETLTKIVLPDTLTGIGTDAFKGCTALHTISVKKADGTIVNNTLPISLSDTNMGDNIFLGCTALETITLPSFTNGLALQKAIGIFSNCTGLTSITVEPGVKVIPKSAFYGAGSTENGLVLTIEEGSQLETIYDSAFQYTTLETVDLSNCTKLERIGNACFSVVKQTTASTGTIRNKEKQLTTIILPETVTSAGLEIGDEAFFRTQLSALYAGEAVENKVALPSYVTKLGDAAFYENTVMTEMVLSPKMDRIGAFTFYGCTSLETVILDNTSNNNVCNITAIDNMAFYNTPQLKDANFVGSMNRLVTIGEEEGWEVSEDSAHLEVKNIKTLNYFSARNSNNIYGSYVFYNSGIETISLPASLRTINNASFSTVTSLREVNWAGDASADGQTFTLGTMAFYGCTALEKFTYPKTAGANSSFVIHGRCFAMDESLVVFSQYDVAKSDGSTNAMPATLTSLMGGAFCDCVSLPAMKITDNTKGASPILGKWIFAFCYELADATLPSTLTAVPMNMYFDCALTDIPKFSGNTNAIQAIGRAAFFGNKMTVVDLRKLPNLTDIGTAAFAYVDVHSAVDKKTVYYSIDLACEGGDGATLTKLILPDTVPGTTGMKWGESMLQAANAFTTVATTSYNKDGVVYIPNYVTQANCGDSVFCDTSVAKVHWGYTDMASGANKWSEIPNGMFAATNIATFSDACIPASDLQKIGGESYATTLMTQLDLTPYDNLTSIGQGAFSNNFNLVSAKLPDDGKILEVPNYMFHVGDYEDTNNVKWTRNYDVRSSLASVDFGTAVGIGKHAFSCVDDVTDAVWYDSSLSVLDFGQTGIVDIGDNAFEGNNGLVTLKLDGVIELGVGSFKRCTGLVMTNTPMADCVQKIGDSAFETCTSIGTVTFGSGLLSIGKSAFAGCSVIDTVNEEMMKGQGLTAVDFTRAVALSSMGQKAFYRTALESFDITPTAVASLDTDALTECVHLANVYLNRTMQKVAANAVSGCVNLSRFEFYSATTIEKTAFKRKGTFANDAGDYVTPISTVTFAVNPVDLNVGMGNEMTFPYYVNTTTNSSGDFSEIIVGDSSNTDANVERYVKVVANASAYYKVVGNNQIQIQEGTYFEKADALQYAVNNSKVYTFSIQGLEKTPGAEAIPFTISAEYKFESGDDTQTQQVPVPIKVTYNLRVMDIPYYPVTYSDSARTKMYDFSVDEETGKTTANIDIRANAQNTTGKITFFYTIMNMYESNWQPDNGNLIIKVSDPSMMDVSGSGVKDVDASTWRLVAEYTTSTGTDVYKATKGKSIVLTPKKRGNCVVTIYPEKSPETTITLSVKVAADIQSITLAPPSEYASGVQVNDKFSILDTVKLYLNETFSRKKETIDKVSSATDNVISYTSDNPSVASIDANGVVTVHKVTSTKVPVTFTAQVALSTGGTLKKSYTYNVVYPPISTSKQMTTSTGETVKVTKKPSGSATTGEVTYVAPKTGSTSVTIPGTVVVSGVTCKVTKIADGAFAGNKTIASVTIGSNVKVIPKEAFSGCTKLTTVTIKGKVTEIGDSAFANCSSLKKITIPKTVTKIGKKAFYKCKKLSKVTIKSSAKLESIGDSAFAQCTSLKSIVIPKKVKTIGAKAFYKCKKLKKISVKSKKVTSVGKNAFKGIYKKAVIDVPNSKLSTYKTLFKKGQGKKVKIK